MKDVSLTQLRKIEATAWSTAVPHIVTHVTKMIKCITINCSKIRFSSFIIVG